MGRTDTVAVRDSSERLSVLAEQLRNYPVLCSAQFGELLRHVLDWAVVPADLDAAGRMAHGCRVAPVGQRLRDVLGLSLHITVVCVVAVEFGDVSQQIINALRSKGLDCLLSARVFQGTQCEECKGVVIMTELCSTRISEAE